MNYEKLEVEVSPRLLLTSANHDAQLRTIVRERVSFLVDQIHNHLANGYYLGVAFQFNHEGLSDNTPFVVTVYFRIINSSIDSLVDYIMHIFLSCTQSSLHLVMNIF